MSTYQKNIEALAKQNPILVSQLLGIDENSRFEVFQDPQDTLNVNIFDHQYQSAFYATVPQQEILQQVDRFEETYNRYPVLFLYGIANGLFSKLLLQNQHHQYLLVFEPEIELLYIALNLIDFSQELEEGRLYLFHERSIDFVKAVEIFSSPSIKVFCKTYHLEPVAPYYEQFYADSLLSLNTHLIRGIEHVITGLGNDSIDALTGLEWHLANVSKMVETPALEDLISKAKTAETAIIIATGPSLAKQLPLLKLIKDHATLLSVDASLPILEKHGIKPDIVFSIERVPITAHFYRETSKEFQKGIICAISSISHPVLVDSVNGMTMQMNMRPFGYTRYFDMPEYGYIGIGMSAANMAYELAFHAGFKTIILIGQDLAYGDDGRSHSEGHVLHTIKHKESDFYIEAYGGNGTVRTSVLWNMFRNFYESDIHAAMQKGIVTINATEGGARIHGALELPFKEAVNHYIDKSVIKQPIILEPVPAEQIQANKTKVEQKIAFMQEYVTSLQKNVSDLFEKVAECTDRLDKINARKHLSKVDYDELASLMGEIDEIKAKFDDPEFVDIFIDATQALIVHQELELASIQVRPVGSDDDRRLKMIDWIYAHKTWLFSLAGIMEAERTVIERRGADAYILREADIVANRIIGYIVDLKDLKKEFEVELIIDGEVVKKRAADQLLYHHLLDQPNPGRFNFEIPERFFDNQVHTIYVRDKNFGIYLNYDMKPVILLESMKTYGQVYEKSKVSYHGWCKKSDSEEKQLIDIFIDDKYMDTIMAHKNIDAFSYLFDKESFGFDYIVPEEYFDDKKHAIRFNPSGNMINLEYGEPIFKLGTEDISTYREAIFLQSLDDISPEEIKDLYSPYTIGFLATEENLKDEEFMCYMYELQEYFKDTKIIAYTMEDSLMNNMEQLPNFQKIILTNYSQLQCVQVLIVNQTNEVDRLVSYKVSWKSILLLSFTGHNMQKTIKELNAEFIVDLYRKHTELFGLRQEEVEKLNNHILIGTLISLNNIGVNKEFSELFDLNMTPKERSYKLIELAFENKNFVRNSSSLRLKLNKLLL